MRICLYTETALPKIGGQELHVDAVARHLLARGHQVVVLAPRPKLVCSCRRFDAQRDYPVVRHPPFFSTRLGLDWYTRYLWLVRQRFPFQVLHCHSVYPTGYVAAVFRQRMDVPVVITSHGGDVRADNPRLRKPQVPQRYTLAVHSASALVAISSMTQQAFQQFGPGLPPVFLVPNGVDCQHFARPEPLPMELSRRLPRRYVLYVGRLHARKGVDVVLRALARIEPTRRPFLAVAGIGPERRRLVQLTRRLQIQHHVAFLGPVQGAAKVALYQHAQWLVVPSQGSEAFGMVVLEGLAAGVPVAASRLPGLQDVVPPQAGWLLPSGDVGAWARLLETLWHHPQAVAEKKAAAQAAARNYDWHHVVAQLERVYHYTLGSVSGKQAA